MNVNQNWKFERLYKHDFSYDYVESETMASIDLTRSQQQLM